VSNRLDHHLSTLIMPLVGRTLVMLDRHCSEVAPICEIKRCHGVTVQISMGAV
jgi:hypothetical protein